MNMVEYMDQRTFPPKVSIVISTYNRAYCIGDAIQSALNQTLPVAEVLIIDDGSTDNTAEVVAGFNFDKLRYVKKENGGLADARNRGVEEAVGDYIIWLDDDDLVLPHVHQTYLELLSEDPNIDIVYGDYRFVDADGAILYDLKHDEFYRNNAFYISRLLTGLRVPHGGSMFHKSVYEKYGLYDVSFKSAPDYDLFVRIARDVSFKHADSIVYIYKIHDGNMSSIRQKSDRTPERRVVKKTVDMFSLDELFPDLDWGNEEYSTARALVSIGNLFFKYKDYSAARLYYLDAAAKFKELDMGKVEDVTECYISIGNTFLQEEKFIDALGYYEMSCRLIESDRVFYKLGVALLKLGRDEEAWDYLESALSITPEHNAAKSALNEIKMKVSFSHA